MELVLNKIKEAKKAMNELFKKTADKDKYAPKNVELMKNAIMDLTLDFEKTFFMKEKMAKIEAQVMKEINDKQKSL